MTEEELATYLAELTAQRLEYERAKLAMSKAHRGEPAMAQFKLMTKASEDHTRRYNWLRSQGYRLRWNAEQECYEARK